jgi:chorismate mutase
MDYKERLLTHRAQIDTIDHEIVYLLSRRFENVKEIGKIKKENNIPALQQDRFKTLLQNLIEDAEHRMLNTKLIEDIWELIHNESLRLEK